MRSTTFKPFFRSERLVQDEGCVFSAQPADGAEWIAFNGPLGNPEGDFLRFRCAFDAIPGEPLRIDFSGDERFAVLFDGVPFAEGPDRGLINHWHVSSFESEPLAPGRHVLEAAVWRLGERGPLAQLSRRCGFVLKAEGAYDALLTTGVAPWTAARVPGTRMVDGDRCGAFGVGWNCEVRGASCIDEIPPETEFAPAVKVEDEKFYCNPYGLRGHGRSLFPTILPPQMSEPRRCGVIHDAGGAPDSDPSAALELPPHSSRTLFWDLGNYYCAYPDFTVSGGAGAKITWGWAESMRDPETGRKCNRSLWKGKSFRGFADSFLPDGRAGARFTTPWWRCGRWCRIDIETAGEPLRIDGFAIVESRYPFESEESFECDDATVSGVRRICVRALQMCSHEMFFDCPFYEQQMYPGDTRVQMLALGAVTRDDRLLRHAMNLFDADRRDDGRTGMNLPTRGTQESMTYTFCWLLMYPDYVRMHADAAWLRARIPGMRHALSGVELYERPDGLLGVLPGWSFMDWVSEWKRGVAPDGERAGAVNAENNLFYLLCLRGAAEVEDALGNAALAEHWRGRAKRLAAAISSEFWDESRGMLADNSAHDRYSEHAQCLALLSDCFPADRAERMFKGLLEAEDLARTTVYFSHYLFEVYLKFGRADLFLKRLDLWRGYVDLGLCTLLERPDEARSESRSDCHAWGAHPLYHLHHGVAGVSAASPFFRTVRVAPCPGPLRFIRARTPVPAGFVETDLRFGEDGSARGSVVLPDGLSGEFAWRGSVTPLVPGRNEIDAK